MNDLVLGVASFLIMLVPMIFLHELGHFIAAKLAGITVLEFGLGFPPRAAKLFERNGTEYTLNWLPIGGFVRPLGEDFVKPVDDETSMDDRQIAIQRGVKNPKSVNEAGPWQRIFFMSAGAGMNFLTAIIIFSLIAVTGLPIPDRVALGVMAVETDSPAAEAGLQPGDLILAANGSPLTEVDIFDNLPSSATDQPIVLDIVRDGESIQLEVSAPADTNPHNTSERVFIVEIGYNSPAAQAGLQTDDTILAANGQRVRTLDDVVGLGEEFAGRQLTLLIGRGSEELEITLVPRENPPRGQGAMGIAITAEYTNPLGFQYEISDTIVDYEAQPLGEALRYGVEQTWFLTTLMIETPVEIIRGNIDPEMARPVSIVGISQIGGERLEESIDSQNVIPILELAGFVSIALGLTNLLPIPGLDGGRILFVIIELLRGRPMDPEKEGLVHLVGLFLLLGLMGIVILNDIINPIIEQLP